MIVSGAKSSIIARSFGKSLMSRTSAPISRPAIWRQAATRSISVLIGVRLSVPRSV